MSKSKIACLLSVAALLCTAPVLADVQARFFDFQGNLLTESVVVVMSDQYNGRTHLAADGVVTVPGLNAGDKVAFQLNDPFNKWQPIYTMVPVDIAEVWDLVATPAQVPDNDLCDDALPVAVPGIVTGSTIGATADIAGTCDTSITAPGVWYSLTGTGTILSASVCPADSNGFADYDTKVFVFCLGCSGLGPACVAGNDDSPNCGFPDFLSTVVWCSEAGSEYLIYMSGYGTGTGNFDLDIVYTGEACTPPFSCTIPDPVCGNGVVEEGEECDPPNGLTCDEFCQNIVQGACCQFTCLDPCREICDVTSEANCAALGGTFLGPESLCAIQGDLVSVPAMGGLAIPDGGPGAGPGPVATQTVEVVDSLIITDLNVAVAISHSWIGDLIFSIGGPAGAIDLWVQICNGGQYQGILTQFDDEGTAQYCNPSGPTPDPTDGNGNITPLGGTPLSVFDGTDAQGTWTFSINDNFENDTGSLDMWSLEIIPGTLTCTGCDDTGNGEEEDDDDGESTIEAIGQTTDGLVHLSFDNSTTDSNLPTTEQPVQSRREKPRSSK